MTKYDCIVVGSGINALVCAALLAKKGRSVCVLERNDRLGGCIRTDEITVPGFTHDMLSGWYPLFVTSPGYHALQDDLAARGVEFCNTGAPTAAVLPDDRLFVLKRARQDNVDAMNALAAGDGERYQQAMAELEKSLDLTFSLIGSELWTVSTVRAVFRATLKMGPHGFARYLGNAMRSCSGWLEQTFQSEETRACIAPWPAHAGIGPSEPLSALMAKIICFSLEVAGCPVVKGGGFRVVEALRSIIEDHGGETHVQSDVDRVLTRNGRAHGVRVVDGRELLASKAVVCSVTPGQLYGRLLDSADVPEAIGAEARAFKHGRADMQIHLALDAPPRWTKPELNDVGMVHLTSGPDGVSRAISEADRGLLPAEATVVVGQPTVLDGSRCPEGKAILWLQLQELPAVIKGDAAGEIDVPVDGTWTEAVRERYADRIVDRVARHIPQLKQNIIGRTVLSPADLESLNINLVGGDPYGGACTLDQYLLWRPLRSLKNHQTPIKQLYHIGASTHPGPGLGGVSGFLVASRL